MQKLTVACGLVKECPYQDFDFIVISWFTPIKTKTSLTSSCTSYDIELLQITDVAVTFYLFRLKNSSWTFPAALICAAFDNLGGVAFAANRIDSHASAPIKVIWVRVSRELISLSLSEALKDWDKFLCLSPNFSRSILESRVRGDSLSGGDGVDAAAAGSKLCQISIWHSLSFKKYSSALSIILEMQCMI